VTRVCFVGGARYGRPLDTTSAKKFRALTALGGNFVIGFSQDLSPRRFTEHAHFYLLPKLPLPVLRYAEMFLLAPFLLLWVIRRHRVRVLIAQSPYEGFAAAWSKKLAGWLGYKVTLVVESHGDFEASLFLQRRVLLPRLYRFLMRQASGFALKHTDALRAVSHSTKEQLQRCCPGKQLVQFTTWTDIDGFLHAGRNVEHHSCQDILYAGVLIPLKGVHHLINAFASITKDFPQARLVVAGRKENRSYAADLKDQVARYDLATRIEFVEEMPQIELAERMRQAYIFALPTYSEGLPRVVLEAMAVGLPVVSTFVSGIPEILKDGVTGWLVPPGDEVMLADRLQWLLEHPEEARAMGRRAREFAMTFFSTEAYLDGYRRLFEASQTVL
jgi:glycosyltransferase involved in cell wall biosynthesis